jgi:hypothetical protein
MKKDINSDPILKELQEQLKKIDFETKEMAILSNFFLLLMKLLDSLIKKKS